MAHVSILIVNWNTRVRLRQCLRALHALPCGIDRETAVIDNGSTDGSADVVAMEFPKVRLLRNPENRGFAKAVNRGIRETRAPFVLLLNSDAELRPGALEALAGYLRDHPEAAAAGAQLETPRGVRQHSFDVFPSPATELLNKGLLRRLFPSRFPSRLQERTEPFPVDSVVGACVLIRRAALESVGPLDERFFVFFEETDWCLRAQRQGWRIVVVPEARAVHDQGETKRRHAGRARVEYWRSKYAYFDKHRGRAMRLLLQATATLRLTVQCACRVLAWAATLGLAAGARRKAAADGWLWAWHLLGTPSAMGFAPAGPTPGYLRVRAADGVRWVPKDRALAMQGSPLRRLGEFLDSPAAARIKEGRTKRHYRVTLAEGGAHRDWVVKVYKAGGLGAALKRALRGSRALRELERMCETDRRGVPVAAPAMAGEWMSGPRAGESYLVFESLDGWTSLDAYARTPAEGADALRRRRDVVRGFGRFARDVYDAGVYQDDFNPTNVLVRLGNGGTPEFLLVDFERVRMYPVVPRHRRLWTIAKMGRVREWGTGADAARFLREVLPSRHGKAERHAFARDLAQACAQVRARDGRKP